MPSTGAGCSAALGPRGTAVFERSVIPSPARHSQPSTQVFSMPGKAWAMASSTARMSLLRTGLVLKVFRTTTLPVAISTGSCVVLPGPRFRGAGRTTSGSTLLSVDPLVVRGADDQRIHAEQRADDVADLRPAGFGELAGHPAHHNPYPRAHGDGVSAAGEREVQAGDAPGAGGRGDEVGIHLVRRGCVVSCGVRLWLLFGVVRHGAAS